MRNGASPPPGFEAIDRRLTAVFLALATALMLVVFVIGSAMYVQYSRGERERLAEVIAHSMGPSFEVAKSAGKYRMQELARQMRAGHIGLEYIRIVDPEMGEIVQEGEIGGAPGRADARLLPMLGAHDRGPLEVRTRDDLAHPVIEVAYVLRGGYQGEWKAVLRVGVRGAPLQTALLEALGITGGVLMVMLLIAWPVVRRVSRSLARPIRTLARDFDGVMAHSPLFITIEDEQGRIEKASATFRQSFGIPEGQRPLTASVFPPEVIEAKEAAEVRLIVDGEPRVLLTNRFPVSFDAEGRVLREGIIGADVTAWREAQTARDQLAAAVENAEELVLITRPGAGVVYANQAFYVFSGHRKEDVIGQDPTDLLFATSAEAPPPPTADTAERFRGRVMLRRREATPVLCDLLVSPIESAGSRGRVWMGRDVSRESEIEQQLRQSQKMEAIGRLAGGVAHDFNNLLTVINGATGMLLEEDLDDVVEDHVRMIEAAGQRAAELTRQLLAFSRRQVLELVEIDLNAVVQSALPLLRSAVGREVDLCFSGHEDLWVTRADVGQIEQVLMNLAINAKDAMEGVLGGRVEIRTENAVLEGGVEADGGEVPPGEYVVLSVLDTGHGIDATTLASVFEPFFTTKGTGKGTGLGLATVYGIVRQSGGHVFVFSSVGVGTTFRIALPRIAAPTRSAAQPPVVNEIQLGHGERVLVVDDDDATRQIITRMLERGGYQPEAVKSGVEALEWLDRHQCDVVLTDIVMPQMSGVDLELVLRGRHPDLPVVFMSGYSESAVDLRVEGVTLVSKPPSRPALFTALRDAIRA